MIFGVLVVNSSGGLIFQRIKPDTAFAQRLASTGLTDKLIAFGSSLYTIIELLDSVSLCPIKRYRKLCVQYDWGAITALQTPTRVLFVVIHSPDETEEDIAMYVDALYVRYVKDVLYDPLYSIDDPICTDLFNPPM